MKELVIPFTIPNLEEIQAELLSAIKTFVGLRVWVSRQLSRLFRES